MSSHGGRLSVLRQGLTIGTKVPVSAVLIVLKPLGKRHNVQKELELLPDSQGDKGVIDLPLQALVPLVGHSPVRHGICARNRAPLEPRQLELEPGLETRKGSATASCGDG